MHDVAHLLAGGIVCKYYEIHELSGLIVALAAAADAEDVWQDVRSLLGCLRIASMTDCVFEEHATFTHTLLYLMLLVFVAYSGARLVYHLRFDEHRLPDNVLRAMCVAACSHLLLDLFTIQGDSTEGTHQYLWPITDFEFHLDTIFGRTDDVTRLRWITEWILYHPFAWWTLCARTKFMDDQREIEASSTRRWNRFCIFVLLAIPSYFSPHLFGVLIIVWIGTLPKLEHTYQTVSAVRHV
jgi:membrane-bound metal-dependent hydrolase YbcI (DUF457 family)